MSLDSGKLHRGFLRWFRVPESIHTNEQAEQKLAHIYHEYAVGAEDVSGEHPDNLDVLKFRKRLNFSRSGSGRDLARQIDSAFVSYWTGTTFPTLVVPPSSPPCPNVGGTGEFSVEISSQVISVETDAMYNAVLPVFSRIVSAEEAARRLAEAMDRVTRQAVTVLITGQDTGLPSPITNTCTVF